MYQLKFHIVLQLETINRLLKKQSRPRAKRAGGPTQSAGSSVPPAATASASTSTRGKRGGARGGRGRGRGRGGARSRTSVSNSVAAADEEGEEVEGEPPEGDAMDIDGPDGDLGNGEDGAEVEDVEGEEVEGVEGSVGSDQSKGTLGPVVPMFKWVSTTIPVPSEVAAPVQLGIQELSSGSAQNSGGDVDMADVSVSNTSPPAEASALDVGTTNAPRVVASLEMLATVSAAVPVVPQEKQIRMYLAIPAAFLPPSENLADTVTSFDGPPRVPTRGSRPPAICAISGCESPRKYRLVRDWRIGACGMVHLKALEGISGQN